MKSDLQLTIIKVEVLRANLRLASCLLQAQIPELASLDNVNTAALGDAIEKIDGVNLWLMTWQATLEIETNAKTAPRD